MLYSWGAENYLYLKRELYANPTLTYLPHLLFLVGIPSTRESPYLGLERWPDRMFAALASVVFCSNGVSIRSFHHAPVRVLKRELLQEQKLAYNTKQELESLCSRDDTWNQERIHPRARSFSERSLQSR